jgi:hypothetical protein
MPSSRTNLVIALAVGALVSALLLVLEPLTDFAFLWLEWPGISAAYFFWGAVGGSTVVGIAICWVVNAVAYGFGAFVILSAFSALKEA